MAGLRRILRLPRRLLRRECLNAWVVGGTFAVAIATNLLAANVAGTTSVLLALLFLLLAGLIGLLVGFCEKTIADIRESQRSAGRELTEEQLKKEYHDQLQHEQPRLNFTSYIAAFVSLFWIGCVSALLFPSLVKLFPKHVQSETAPMPVQAQVWASVGGGTAVFLKGRGHATVLVADAPHYFSDPASCWRTALEVDVYGHNLLSLPPTPGFEGVRVYRVNWSCPGQQPSVQNPAADFLVREDEVAPHAPERVVCFEGDGKLTLRWKASDSPDVEGYIISAGQNRVDARRVGSMLSRSSNLEFAFKRETSCSGQAEASEISVCAVDGAGNVSGAVWAEKAEEADYDD